jgi:hypothetical protein
MMGTGRSREFVHWIRNRVPEYGSSGTISGSSDTMLTCAPQPASYCSAARFPRIGATRSVITRCSSGWP